MGGRGSKSGGGSPNAPAAATPAPAAAPTPHEAAQAELASIDKEIARLEREFAAAPANSDQRRELDSKMIKLDAERRAAERKIKALAPTPTQTAPAAKPAAPAAAKPAAAPAPKPAASGKAKQISDLLNARDKLEASPRPATSDLAGQFERSNKWDDIDRKLNELGYKTAG